jgi:hypothetical protein
LPCGDLLEQLAKEDLRLLLGLHRSPVAQFPAGQRIDARVYMDMEGAARQSL